MARSPAVVVVPVTPHAERVVDALATAGVDADPLPADATLARLHGDPPDCVVCLDDDDRTATELLAAIRERRRDVPAVVVGGDPLVGGATTRVVEDDVDAVVDGVRATLADGPDEAVWGSATAKRGRFATLVEELPDPAIVTTLEDEPVVQYANPAFERTFGYDAADVVGSPVDEVLVPPGEQRVDLRSLEDEAVVERTVTRSTVDGPREFVLRGMRAGPGSLEEGFVVYSDVTARRERAEQLDALHGVSRRLLAAETKTAVADIAVDAAQEVLGLPATGALLIDGDGDRLEPAAYTDETAEMFDGPPPSNEPGSIVWDVYEAGELLVVPDVDEAPDVEADTPVESAVLLPLGEHGVLVSTSQSVREFDDATVDLASVLAANTEAALDDAEHRAALRARERELRAERDRLSSLFENTPIAAVRVDHRDGEPYVVEVNPAFEETFGYDAAELMDQKIDEFVLPDEGDVTDSVKDEAAAGEPITREVRRQTADGMRDFLLTTAPVEPGTPNEQAYGFYIDITERRQRQERLRVLSRVLRHDIRNRMNVIDGNAELVREWTDEPEVEDVAGEVQRAAAELLSLSNRTRQVERTIADAMGEGAAPIRPVVQAVVDDVQGRYFDAGFDLDVPDDLDVATPQAVRIALLELLENALEHSDRAAPSVSVQARASADAVTIEVCDDGPGVPEHERALLEGDRQPSQLEHTSGMGLWLVKWVVTAAGGDVSIVEREPRGTTVRLWLPRG